MVTDDNHSDDYTPTDIKPSAGSKSVQLSIPDKIINKQQFKNHFERTSSSRVIRNKS
jgi:hypothetical protein